jgi:hypothetical protein
LVNPARIPSSAAGNDCCKALHSLGIMKTRTLVGLGATALAAFLLSGCGSVRETLPARSALEQLLISTAADRAVATLALQPFLGKSVYIDAANLECQDKAYVLQRLRSALRSAGARVVDHSEEAEIVLEAAAGVLSIDRRDMLFGLPALPFPFQVGGQTLRLPEVPLWKLVTYGGRAKLLFSAVDTATGKEAVQLGHCHGKARDTYWWLFVVGPMRSTDLPEPAR